MPLQSALSLGLRGARTGGGVATTMFEVADLSEVTDLSEGTELSAETEDGGDPFSDLTCCGQSLE
jgi:hypothetical protein